MIRKFAFILLLFFAAVLPVHAGKIHCRSGIITAAELSRGRYQFPQSLGHREIHKRPVFVAKLVDEIIRTDTNLRQRLHHRRKVLTLQIAATTAHHSAQVVLRASGQTLVHLPRGKVHFHASGRRNRN